MPTYPGRKKGTRRIVVRHNGRKLEKVIEGTKAEAEEFEARWRIELAQGDPVDPKTVPRFSDFCVDHYAPHARTHLKSTTWQNVRVYQVDTLAKFFGKYRLHEIAVKLVDAYKADRQKTIYRGKPIGATAINNELRILKTILFYARDLGYQIAPLKWKRVPERGHGRVRVWTRGEVQRILDAAHNLAPDLVPMLLFLFNTGCRKGEAIAAEWSWVDETAWMLRIPSNEVWQPKNGKPREIPISDALREVLRQPRRHAHYLFPSRDGDRYAYFPKDVWSKVRTKAKVRGGPHTTRHTFASFFLQARPDLFLLAELLGHSATRVTELYSHLLPDHLERARNAVNLTAGETQKVAEPVATEDEKGKSPEKK